jgi:hypothetical protein
MNAAMTQLGKALRPTASRSGRYLGMDNSAVRNE